MTNQIYQRKSDIINSGQLLTVSEHDQAYSFSVERLRFRHVTEQTFSPKNTFEEHTHKVYHIVLYTKGEANFIYKEQVYNATPGTLLIISPDEPHNFVSSAKTAYDYIALTFFLRNKTGEDLDLSFQDLLSTYSGAYLKQVTYPLQLAEKPFIVMQSILEMLMKELLHGSINWVSVNIEIMKLFNQVLKSLYDQGTPQTNLPEILEPILNYIHQKYNTTIELNQLAKLSNISKGYMIRIFTKHIGLSPIQYQQQLRIEKAIKLLINSSKPIKEIAETVGYDNVYYFSKIFKKVTELPPGHYRNYYSYD